MAELAYTFRSQAGAIVKIARSSHQDGARILIQQPSGADVLIYLEPGEIADLAGGLAIVRDYR